MNRWSADARTRMIELHNCCAVRRLFINAKARFRVERIYTERQEYWLHIGHPVIPAKAGIHSMLNLWIPAFAGMTSRAQRCSLTSEYKTLLATRACPVGQ